MKIPKLKYWFLAMAAGNYSDFEATRRVEIQDAVTIDVATGRITGQTHVYLAASVPTADDHYRWQFKTTEPLWILRIPRECVDRSWLTPTDHPAVWRCNHSLHIPHCGVERVDLG